MDDSDAPPQPWVSASATAQRLAPEADRLRGVSAPDYNGNDRLSATAPMHQLQEVM
jgi:hypothetical protein